MQHEQHESQQCVPQRSVRGRKQRKGLPVQVRALGFHVGAGGDDDKKVPHDDAKPGNKPTKKRPMKRRDVMTRPMKRRHTAGSLPVRHPSQEAAITFGLTARDLLATQPGL